MGEPGLAVDVAALRGVGTDFDRVAELVAALQRQAAQSLRFGPALAGRAHVSDGDAVRRALDRYPVLLGQWSRAAAEIGAALGAGAARYLAADVAAAGGID